MSKKNVTEDELKVVTDPVTLENSIAKAEKEYSDEWDRVEAEIKIQEEQKGFPGTLAKTDEKAPEQTKDVPPQNEPILLQDSVTGEAKVIQDRPDNTEKRLKDTQAYSTKLAQENADLKRKQKELQDTLSEYDKGKSSKEELHAAKVNYQDAKSALTERIKKVSEDYPELAGVLEEIANITVSTRETLVSKEQEQKQRDQAAKDEADRIQFETVTKPEIMKQHPDYEEVIGKDRASEFVRWAESDMVSPAIRTAALYSNNVGDVCMAISEFKAYKSGNKLASLKSADESKKEIKIQNLQTLRGGQKPYGLKTKEKDPNDTEGAWEEAGEILKRQGIGK